MSDEDDSEIELDSFGETLSERAGIVLTVLVGVALVVGEGIPIAQGSINLLPGTTVPTHNHTVAITFLLALVIGFVVGIVYSPRPDSELKPTQYWPKLSLMFMIPPTIATIGIAVLNLGLAWVVEPLFDGKIIELAIGVVLTAIAISVGWLAAFVAVGLVVGLPGIVGIALGDIVSRLA